MTKNEFGSLTFSTSSRRPAAEILQSIRIDRVKQDDKGEIIVESKDLDTTDLNHFSLLSQLEDIETKPSITGVITFHVKEVTKMYLSDNWSGEHMGLYIEMSCRGVSKRTTLATDDDGNPKWGQSIHLPVLIPTERLHPFNLVQVNLICTDMSNTGFEKYILGSTAFHIHDIIRALSTDSHFDLFENERFAGTLHMSVMFNYGLYGYGYSAQFPIGRPIDDQLENSLFPRVEPPESRKEPKRATLIPRAVAHPSFIPFREKVEYLEMNPKEDKSQEEIKESLSRTTKKLEVLRDTLNKIGGRSTRLAFLNSQLKRSMYPQESIVFDSNKFRSKGGYNSRTYQEQADTHSRQDFLSWMKPARVVQRIHEGRDPEKEKNILRRQRVRMKSLVRQPSGLTSPRMGYRKPQILINHTNITLPGGIMEEDEDDDDDDDEWEDTNSEITEEDPIDSLQVRRVKSDLMGSTSMKRINETAKARTGITFQDTLTNRLGAGSVLMSSNTSKASSVDSTKHVPPTTKKFIRSITLTSHQHNMNTIESTKHHARKVSIIQSQSGSDSDSGDSYEMT